MVDRSHELPITRQCLLLSLNRSTFYYQRKSEVSEEDLKLMRRIDEMHMKRPFYGSRRIRDWLREESYNINRKRVQRLLAPIYAEPKPAVKRNKVDRVEKLLNEFGKLSKAEQRRFMSLV